MHRIADADAPGDGHVAVDAERQRLGHALPPVAGEELERVEVGDAVVRVARGHDAAADVAVQRDDHRIADRNAVSEPRVLLVRLDPVDLEQHPEAAPVDRLVGSGLRAQPLERRHARPPRRPAAAVVAAILCAALRPEQRQRLAGELGDRVLPRPEARFATDEECR